MPNAPLNPNPFESPKEWAELIATESRGKLVSSDLSWSMVSGTVFPALFPATKAKLLRRERDKIQYQPFHPESLNGCIQNGQRIRVATLSLEGLKERFELDLMTDGPLQIQYWDAVGANPVTQLALGLWTLDRRLHASRTISPIQIGVQGSLITEIAKLRASRMLFDHLLMLFGQDAPIHLSVLGSVRHLSPRDEYNNLVRITLSCAAGVAGGADRISLPPFNVFTSGLDDLNAARHSENVFRLLCFESYVDQVHDPLSGSDAVESLTTHLADASWDLFLRWKDHTVSQLCEEFLESILKQDEATWYAGFKKPELAPPGFKTDDSKHMGRVIVGENKYESQAGKDA